MILTSPLWRYFLATRPAFLPATFVAVLVGLACAHVDGISLQRLPAALTLLFALLAHAGANVLNDYYDALNGTDAANSERLFPFTGGSRFIQNGVLTARQMALFGATLLAVVVTAGLWLAAYSGVGLLGIGLLGLLIGWAYSAPPLKLASRGLGEIAVTVGWLLVVVGADYVQRGDFGFMPLVGGLGYALLLANLLFINQFPDWRSDALTGKRTLVVRLGRRTARWVYLVLALAAHGWLLVGIARGILPDAAIVAMLAAPLALHGAQGLWQHAEAPARLARAIKFSAAAVLVHGLLLAGALLLYGGHS